MKKVLRNNFVMLGYVAKSCPAHIALTVFVALLSSLASVADILLMKYIIDGISNPRSFRTVGLYLVLLIAFALVTTALSSYLAANVIPRNTQIVRKKMQLELYRKATKMEFRCYEDRVFYDKFVMAISQADSRALSVLDTFTSLLGLVVTFGALLTIIASLQPSLLMVATAGVSCSLAVRVYSIRVNHKYRTDSLPISREAEYIQRVVYQREYAQEIRLYPKADTLLQMKYSSNVQKFFGLIRKYGFRLGVLSFCGGAISTTVSGVSMLYLARQVFFAGLSVGSFVALSNSCTQLFAQASGFFDVFFQMYEHSIYIDHFQEFVEYDDARAGGRNLPIPEQIDIAFRDVRFHYDGMRRNAVENVSLNIQHGETIAIVGFNGSGKSTLVKLLTGLYTPTEGTISLNSIPIEDYDRDAFLQSVGVVLQDFQLFAFTIAENILMRPLEGSADEQLVFDALSFAGILPKVLALPNGIHTDITREFSSEGAIFSGGERQKLALARAYAKKCKILILDEPFSALDPIAEVRAFNKVMEFGRDKTIIIISHNLSSVQSADKIYVMADGEIVEQGSHDELLEQGGRYYEMYSAGDPEMGELIRKLAEG